MSKATMGEFNREKLILSIQYKVTMLIREYWGKAKNSKNLKDHEGIRVSRLNWILEMVDNDLQDFLDTTIKK